MSKRIKDAIVRKYPVIDLDDSLFDAIDTMAQNNISALVVNRGDELIGLVTITDIMFSLAEGNDMQDTPVGSFMTQCDLITSKETKNPCAQLDEELDAISAIKVMHEAGVHHLLVSGAKGRPVGIVSSLELIKLLAS